MFGRLLLIAILALPLVEIALFVVIGGAIGVLPTLLGVVLTSLAGVLVLRWQGVATLHELRARLSRGELPARQMADAMLVGLGGFLLLLPGYFTDLVGLLLVLPPTRQGLYALLARHFRAVDRRPGGGAPADPGLIEINPDDWRDGPRL